MANVFVSIPILDRPEFRMIQSLYTAAYSSKHSIRLYFNENDSLISRVRNVHISVFHDQFPDCDYFISLDSDIEIMNVFKGENIFDKLVAHNVDFVGGLYALKREDRVASSSITITGDIPKFNTGLVETPWLSSGCWCLKRSAVTKMINAYPELHYDGDDNATGSKVYGLYIPMIYDLKETDFPSTNKKLPFRKYLSEDWSFAQRWYALGGKIFADTSIILKHVGRKSYALWGVEIVRREVPKREIREIKQSAGLPQPGFDL